MQENSFEKAFPSTEKYNDIIKMKYVKSNRHGQMTAEERAAQFAPYAPLKGHDECIEEAAAEALLRANSRDVEEWYD